jgi:hypothetical protein
MLKQDKTRKYNCPVQLAVYGHTVEGTIYLTVVNVCNRHRLTLRLLRNIMEELEAVGIKAC